MMRWLKDKKREKRSNSVGCDDEDDDDYGFEKEKTTTTMMTTTMTTTLTTTTVAGQAASKSPLTRRQLPPTPLTPEEKSPHIYEEIHDGQVVYSSSAAAQSGSSSTYRVKRLRHGSAGGAAASSASVSSGSYIASSSLSSKYIGNGNDAMLSASSAKDDSISPYMVVPVDEEVRQTPTNFHRNGTPEVHCDVIVKETHCEIFLSRKPKVSAFKPDANAVGVERDAYPSSGNLVSNGNPTIRNNTHFCSRNRRASVDVHSIGGKSNNSSSGGPWNSSAFSSSSTSRVNSVGASMMSLSTLSERDNRLPSLDDASSGSSAKGVLTYTVGGNTIARATKLTFNPLKPMDGDDTSLSNLDPFFTMMPPPPSSSDSSVFADVATASPPSIPNPTSPATLPTGRLSNQVDNTNSPIVYSTMSAPSTHPPNTNNFAHQPYLQGHLNPDSQPQQSSTTTPKSSSNFVHDSVPPSTISNPASNRGYNPEQPFHPHIRASSPSNASSCTYASVSFPTEPKIYNTIAPDLISKESTRELQSHTVLRHLESSIEGESETESVRYSSIQDTTTPSFGNMGIPGNQTMPNATIPILPPENSGEIFQFGAACVGTDDSVYSGVMAYRIDPESTNLLSPGCCAGTTLLSQSQLYSSGEQSRTTSTNNNNTIASSVSTTYNSTLSGNHTHPIPHNSAPNVVPSDSSSIIYSGIINQNEAVMNDECSDNISLYASIENNSNFEHNNPSCVNGVSDNTLNGSINKVANSTTNNISIDTSEADVDRLLYGEAAGMAAAASAAAAVAVSASVTNSLLLDFCTCSDDQHSSGCGGFMDGKADDDTSSIATTINEPRGPCTGCGRLIRQITYSESYSDETYEHVYSSRLLLRRGRRYSSPDITGSEISNSETNREFEEVKGQCHFGTMSRDDTWMTSRHDYAPHTFYRQSDSDAPVVNTNLLLNQIHGVQSATDQVQSSIPSPANSNPAAKPRQSFSAFGLTTKNPNILRDNSTGVSILAHHRSSLPAINPSNLVPVTDVVAPSTTTSQLHTKGSAFSNLLSKFSRPKLRHANRVNEVAPLVASAKHNQIPNIESTPADAKLSNVCTPSQNPAPSDAPIPEKNTTKLSKFFQRLSNSDVGEGKEEMKNGKDNKKREEDFKTKALNVEIPDCSASNVITSTTANTNNNIDTTNTNTNSNNTKLLQSPPCEHISSDPSVTQYGAHISAFKGKTNLSPNASKPGADNPNAQIKPEDVSILLDVSSSDHSPGRQPTRITSAQTNTNEALVDTIIMGENKTAIGASSAGCDEVNAMNVGSEPNARPQNKTDSGDTCYEYDISTSSESEQTSYDYFLSKVKKSLNLEHEVQQIADMSNLRKKAFCKKCKRSDLYGSSHAVDADDNESVGSDGGCPHLSAKFGDLRKIFGDFVVDQRAAILDCLTDYAHGPFNVKGEGRENTCRGCGGEIMTSDSESMTTVYSILSQQFRMTSPGTHTPSCDSDDGTMADNSCESADDEDNDVSSGYDEATGPICEHYSSHKTKRKEKSRERKERKLHHSSGNVASSCRDHEKSLKKKNSAHGAAHSKPDGGKSGGNNSNFKRHHGAADNNNKYIVSENKHQSRQKQDTVHSIDTSIHSSSTTAFQKNSLRKEGSSTGNQSHCGPSFNNSNNNNNNNNNSNNNDNNNMGAQISNNSHPKNNNIYNQSGADSKHVCDQLFKHGEAETVSLSNVNNTSDTTNSNSGTTSTTNKPRPRLLATEKVIQDIYAPLPSKALSWLTARCCINNNPLISNNNNNNNNINSNNQEEHPNIFTSPSCSSANLATVEPNTSTTNFIQNSQVTESPDKGTKVTNVIPPSLPTHNHDNPTVVGGTVTCKAPGHGIAIAATTTTTTTTPCSSSSSCFNNNNNKHNSLDSMQTRCDVLQTKEGDNSSASLVTVGGTAATIDDPPHKGTRQYADGHKLPAELKDGDRLEYNVEVGVGDIEGKSSERGDVCSADNTQTRLSAPGKFVTPLIDGSERTRPLIDTSKCSVDSRAGSTPDRKQSKDTEIGGHGNQARIPIPDVLTSRQKQKQLQMAALDLLPETVLGSDVDDVSLRNECGNTMEATVSQKDQQQQQQQQRIKSKRVERLAKMFENNSNSNSSPCLASTLKSENNSNSSRKKPSASESTMTTTSLSATTTTNIAGGDTRGVTKFTDAITSTATTITGTTTNNNSGRSFINKTATTAVATAMTWSSPQINTTTTIITTATTATTDIDNTTTMETRANRSDPVTIGQTPHVKPGTLPRPGPSPSIVKKPLFPSHSTAPSSSIPIPAPTTKSDHPVKSPLYHSRSCSSSLLSLPSSSPQTSDKNVLDKNQAFNTNTNTLESNSGTTPGPPGPPATNKPVLCNKTSSILQTKSKFERSRKIESRKGREQNSSDNDRETQTRDTTPKSSKDKSKRIVSGNEPTRRRFKPQDSESDSKPSTTTSTTSRKQLVSPSLSTSSGSSSKRNRNGTGSTSNGGGSGNTTRQKKLSKRGHPHRRARSKSERRHKSSHHHHQHGEERTRYYFSSDLSDIDVIEVEDWETYSSSRAVGGSTAAASSNSNANSTSRDLSSGKSNALERRKRLDKESSRKSRSTADVESSSFAEDSGDHSMIQEVYSIPPNSSEIRGGGAIGGVVASAAADIGSASSPQMSPDVATKLPKKSKKSTDAIYKTKKNNNKLLSDLIIRNYDRQMYDVGNGYNENSGNGCVVNNSSGGNV